MISDRKSFFQIVIENLKLAKCSHKEKYSKVQGEC